MIMKLWFFVPLIYYISHSLTFHVIFRFSAFWRFLRRHHRNQEEFHQEIPHQITFYKACHVSSLWIIEWHRCILLITGPDTQQFVNYRYLYNSKRTYGSTTLYMFDVEDTLQIAFKYIQITYHINKLWLLVSYLKTVTAVYCSGSRSCPSSIFLNFLIPKLNR